MQDEREKLKYWGCSYYYGWDDNQNVQNALNCLEKLRGIGDGFGSYMIGMIKYDYKMYEDAYAYFYEASQMGYSYADYMIAILFENGLGVQKDNAIAINWYIRAAEAGIEAACDQIIKKCQKYNDILQNRKSELCAEISPKPYNDGHNLWIANDLKLVAPDGYMISIDEINFKKEVYLDNINGEEAFSYYLRNIYSRETLIRTFDYKVKNDNLPPAFDIDELEYISEGKKVINNGVVICDKEVNVRAKIIEQESGLDLNTLDVKVNGNSVPYVLNGDSISDYVLEFIISEYNKICDFSISMQDNVGNKKIIKSDAVSIPKVIVLTEKPVIKFYDKNKEINNLYSTDSMIQLGIKICHESDCIAITKASLSIDYAKEAIQIEPGKKEISNIKQISKPGMYIVTFSFVDILDDVITKTISIKLIDEHRSQYYFLKEVNENAYKSIREAEKKIKRNHEDISNNVRNALEAIVNDLYTGLNDNNPSFTLNDKIYALSKNNALPKLNNQMISYLGLDDNEKEIKGEKGVFKFIRLYGNVGSHQDINDDWMPKKTYENAILVLKLFHHVAISYVEQKTGKKIDSKFSEQSLPIGDYTVESNKKISGDMASVTGCKYEYICYRKDSKKKKRYSLIREYTKNEAENFILRNNMVFDESYNERKHMDAMANVSHINEINEEFSKYYYVVYEVGYNKPEPLTRETLSQLSLIDKLKICKNVSDTLAVWHTLDNPICIRMLNYEGIILEMRENDIGAYFIRYDYAKIKGQDTVLNKLNEINQIKHQASLEKYKAPEFDVKNSNENIGYWEKIDLYALGVLIRDIILGNPNSASVPAMSELEKYEIGQQLKDTIRLLADVPEKRPSAGEVALVIEMEISRQLNNKTE